MNQSFESRIWFKIRFLPLKESLSHMNSFCNICTYFDPIELSGIKLSKVIPSILMEKFDRAIFPGLSYLFL